MTSQSQRPIEYKGEPLDAERGPGLGCFRFQLAVLVVFVVLTPLTVAWKWPTWISVLLLFAVIVLLLVAGQTVIFLLRLVAADRRTRRQPLGSATKTVGQLEDEAASTGGAVDATGEAAAPPGNTAAPGDAAATDTSAPSDAAAPGDAAADAPGTAGEPVPRPAPEPPSDEGPVRQ